MIRRILKLTWPSCQLILTLAKKYSEKIIQASNQHQPGRKVKMPMEKHLHANAKYSQRQLPFSFSLPEFSGRLTITYEGSESPGAGAEYKTEACLRLRF